MDFNMHYFSNLITEKDQSISDDMKSLLNYGKEIARKLGLVLNGWQEAFETFPGKFMFTDKKTDSSFMAGDEEEARKNLSRLRMRYGIS